MPMRPKVCCCCGENAGRWEQWWNRDAGFGICRRCVVEAKRRESAMEVLSLFGVEGVHYPPAGVMVGTQVFPLDVDSAGELTEGPMVYTWSAVVPNCQNCGQSLGMDDTKRANVEARFYGEGYFVLCDCGETFPFQE